MAISVSIVEDNEDLRSSLTLLINGAPGFRCVSDYGSAEEAVHGLPVDRPDIAIMDINLPGMSGIDCLSRLKTTGSSALFLVLTVHDDDDVIFNALQAGATGYLLKDTAPSDLLNAITELQNGGAPMSSNIARRVLQFFHDQPRFTRPTVLDQLTQREGQILELLTKGYLYKEIAADLGISFDTVHTHIRNIYGKLQVRSRSEAIAAYLQN